MIINVIVLSAQVGLGSVDQVGQHVRCGFCQGGYATPSTLVVLKFVGPHNPRGATSEESPSKSALQVLSYARFLACAVRTEVQHPRRHTRNTHTHTGFNKPAMQFATTCPPPRKTVRETSLTNPVGVGRTSRVPTSTRVCSKVKLQALALWVARVRVNKLRCAEHNLGTVLVYDLPHILCICTSLPPCPPHENTSRS